VLSAVGPRRRAAACDVEQVGVLRKDDARLGAAQRDGVLARAELAELEHRDAGAIRDTEHVEADGDGAGTGEREADPRGATVEEEAPAADLEGGEEGGAASSHARLRGSLGRRRDAPSAARDGRRGDRHRGGERRGEGEQDPRRAHRPFALGPFRARLSRG
jgi:hypothetical protein